MAETIQELLAQRQQVLGEDSRAGFVDSAWSSMTNEMIGLDPLAGVDRWRAENPTAALVSQMLGFGVPYLGWMKAARAVRPFEAWVSTLGASGPQVLGGALRAGTRFAPFEASRIALATAFGGDIGEVSESALINIGLEAGLGAAGGALRSYARTRPNRVFEAAGAEIGDSMQLTAQKVAERLRQAETGIVQMTDEELGVTREALSNLRNAIRTQSPLRGNDNRLRPYTEGNFEIGGSGWTGPAGQLANAREFNRMFALPETPLMRRGATRHMRDVLSTSALEDMGGVHLLDNIQFGREMLLRQGALNSFKNRRLARMQQVDTDTWIAKEHNDGLWLMAKRLRRDMPEGLNFNNAAAKASMDWERWALFKTDRPETFSPKNALWAANVRDKVFDVETIVNAAGAGPYVEAMNKFFGMVDYKVVGGRPRGVARRIGEMLGAEKLVDTGPMKALSDMANKTIVPAMYEMRRSLRATRLRAATRHVFNEAQKQGNALLYGRPDVKNIKSIGSLVLGRGVQLEGGPIQMVHKASNRALEDLHYMMDEFDTIGASNKGLAISPQTERQIASDRFKSGNISEEGRDLVHALSEMNEKLVAQVWATENAFGIQNGIRSLFGHLGLPRTWEGNWRALIVKENDDNVYMVGAHDAGTAERKAQDYIRTAEAEGTRGLRVKAVYTSDLAADMHAAVRLRPDAPEYRKLAEINRRLNLATPRPRSYARRPGVLTAGAVNEKLLTRKQLAEILTDHVENYVKYAAELTVRKGMLNEFDRLKLEDPELLMQLLNRVDDHVGRPGALSKFINKTVDAVVAPVIGPNSASKIVHAANRFIYNWDLGMGNLMFPVVNALTFVQTTLPHIAYVMKAHPDLLQRYYSTLPVSGTDGLVRGSVSTLSPLRVLASSMRQMGRLNQDAAYKEGIGRAVEDSVLDPKFIESFPGQQTSKLTNIRQAFSSPGGFVDGLEAVSSFLPSMSERWSRVQSFTTGWVLGRDVLRIADSDRLYNFAKEFTENTMFLYSTADRARIITGPLGTFLGLFKNWQMHYIGSMMTYANEGLLRGNWNPLLWQTAGTWTLAGAKGLPGFMVADAFSEWGSDQSMMQNIYEWFGPADREGWAQGGDSPLPDAIYMGLPSLLGLSLTSSTGAPFADPVRDAGMMMSFVHLDRMAALTNSVGAGIDAWSTTGQHPITNDETRRQFMRALAPRAIYRAMSVMEGNFIKSMSTGYPSISGLSMSERALYGMGFNPRWVSLQFDVQREMWNDQNSLRAGVARYGQLIAEAKAERDWRMVTRLQQQAMFQGLPLDSIWQSVATREAKGEEDTINRQFSQASGEAYRRLGLVQ